MIKPLVISLATFLAMVAQLPAQESVDFAHDILPILQSRCAKCHTNGTYKGDFSMDSRQSMIDAAVIDLPDVAESELLLRVSSNEPEYRMPPTGDRLSAEEVQKMTTWIATGAAWEAGFTFKKSKWVAPLQPRKPQFTDGPGNPIDRILGVYFRDYGVSPTEPIDDSTFQRRVYLDLIGILPTIDEQISFQQSDDADKREVLIANLLARKRDYADHWMTFWNDLLRNDYAGTGYIDGGRKQITTWLHKSLYENKPYNQFVHQLISPSTESDGFIRGIQWRGNVNASQVREIQFAQNVSQVFLGENLKCASCHDSFINDWKLADAYGMAAIIAEQPLEMFRCDKPTGKTAEVKFLWPELGQIDARLSTEDRLKRMADIITSPENGRLTRTIVNRIWQRMMGRGIVEPVDVMSNRPFDPDLLDFLASYLSDQNYDLKKLIELIANSKSYQLKATIEEDQPASDSPFVGPVIKRLTAEQFCDAIWGLTSTGPDKPQAQISDYRQSEQPAAKIRASLVASNLLMRSLGRPNREQVVTTRSDRLSTLQALDLSNGQELFELMQRGSEKLMSEIGNSEEIVDLIYRQALCRLPTGEEKAICLEMLGEEPTAQAVADFVWVVIMLPEFQYVH